MAAPRILIYCTPSAFTSAAGSWSSSLASAFTWMLINALYYQLARINLNLEAAGSASKTEPRLD